MTCGHPFYLLCRPRFSAFFAALFLTAFNDTVFKVTLVLLLAQRLIYDEEQLNWLANGLYLLPFLLFSASFGQVADKIDHARLIRVIKLAEMIIVLIAITGFYFQQLSLMFAALFLMGLHTALLGPIKFAYLPQHFKRSALIGGNGLVVLGTVIAFLIGQIAAARLLTPQRLWLTGLLMFVVAGLGYWSATRVPRSSARDPALRIDWNFFNAAFRLLGYAKARPLIFFAILGISWFWFYAAIVLTQISAYTHLVVYGNETVVALLLAAVAIGLGSGAMLCHKLSHNRIETGLVPLGSIGLSLFAIDWCMAVPHQDPLPQNALLSVTAFLHSTFASRVLIDLFGLGLFGGFYLVPLYTMLQTSTPRAYQARIIAFNNVMNALSMTIAAALGYGLLMLGLNVPQLILIVSLLNTAVAIYLFRRVPEFFLRFVAWLLIHTFYRLNEQGVSRIPREGAVVLVCNHVSYVDALIITAAVHRPVRFVMHHAIFALPLLNYLFRASKAIPIAAAKEDAPMKARAMDTIAEVLQNGEVVCIFPEGRLTTDGELGLFRSGIEDIVKRTPVPVIPMALRGLWGSIFSRQQGRTTHGVPRRLWLKVELIAGQSCPAHKVTAAGLYASVLALRADKK